MFPPRWWLVPGEIAWTGRIDGQAWRLVYEGDNSFEWTFTLKAAGSQSGYRFRFDHTTLTLISDGADRHVPQVIAALAEPIGRRVGLVIEPGSLHRRIIDEITEYLGVDAWMDGRLLRQRLLPEVSREAVKSALRELMPKYVQQPPPSDFHGEIDQFSLTLGGALASSRTTDASTAIEGVIRLIRGKYQADPLFRSFSLSEVRTTLNLKDDRAARFAESVIRIAHLNSGSHGNANEVVFGAPKDAEYLSECESFAAFLDYISKSTTDRPPPTAPLQLASDRGSPIVQVGSHAMADAPRSAPAHVGDDSAVITELTRRDLCDLLAGSWSGRLTAGEFLARLYTLDELPSHDPRFDTMAADVFQHTEANDDWDSSWVFHDDRLGLSDDKLLLNFVSETVHPAVVDPAVDVRARVRAINKILLPDGFELVPSGSISGRPIFRARSTTPRRPPTGAFRGSLISGMAQALAKAYTHTGIDSLFEDQDFPRPSDVGANKVDKVKAWLRAGDQEEDFDHWEGIGKVLEVVLEAVAPEGSDLSVAQHEIRALLGRQEIAYLPGGVLATAPGAAAAPSVLTIPATWLPPPAEWRQLGQGGFGTVYAIRDHRLEQDFAIKVFDPSPFNAGPDARFRFMREAGLLFQLRHDSIIRIFDASTLADGRPYIKMELFDGGTLQATLDGRRLSVEEGVLIIGRLAAALEHAHAQLIYHRDMKPSNVLVGPALDQVRLIDFGLGILVEEAVARTRLTTSAHQFGSAYSAPELLENAKELGPHLDVYSLGAIWFRIVGGRPPQGAGIDESIETSELDRTLKQLLRRCLSEKLARPAVAEVLSSLREWHRAYKGSKQTSARSQLVRRAEDSS